MTSITLTQIGTAISGVIASDATGINEVQDAALSESIQDLPLVQVYWQTEETEAGTQTERFTFGGGVQQSDMEFYADVYVKQRGQLDEDIPAVTDYAEKVREALKLQKTANPFFGLSGIKAFHWRAERVTFDYSSVQYAGIRYTITVKVF